MADDYPMRIEWWKNEDGEYNWHALSGTSDDAGNNRVLFGSVQGYKHKAELIQNISTWFPHAEIVPRDGESPSSVEEARADLVAKGQAE